MLQGKLGTDFLWSRAFIRHECVLQPNLYYVGTKGAASRLCVKCGVRGRVSRGQPFPLQESLLCFEEFRKWAGCKSHVLCIVDYRIWKLCIGLRQRQCAWLGFANAKFWTESTTCMLRRLVSQVESFQRNSQLYWALMNFAYEHFSSDTNQLPIALMTFAGEHCSMARFIAKVSCIVGWGMPERVNHIRWRLTFGKQA